MPPLDATRLSVDGRPVLAVRGEVDLASAHDLVLAATSADADGPLALDLSEVTFIDSTGVSALLAIWREAARVGRSVELIAISGPVARVLELAGVGDLFGLGG